MTIFSTHHRSALARRVGGGPIHDRRLDASGQEANMTIFQAISGARRHRHLTRRVAGGLVALAVLAASGTADAQGTTSPSAPASGSTSTASGGLSLPANLSLPNLPNLPSLPSLSVPSLNLASPGPAELSDPALPALRSLSEPALPTLPKLSLGSAPTLKLPSIATITPSSLPAGASAWAGYFSKAFSSDISSGTASVDQGLASTASFGNAWSAMEKTIGTYSSGTGGLSVPSLGKLPALASAKLPNMSMPALPSVASPSLTPSQISETLGVGANFTLAPPPGWSSISVNPVYGGLAGATKAYEQAVGCAGAASPSATCLAGISDSALSKALSATGVPNATSPSRQLGYLTTPSSLSALSSSLLSAAASKQITDLVGTKYKSYGADPLTHNNPALSSPARAACVVAITLCAVGSWLHSHLHI